MPNTSTAVTTSRGLRPDLTRTSPFVSRRADPMPGLAHTFERARGSLAEPRSVPRRRRDGPRLLRARRLRTADADRGHTRFTPGRRARRGKQGASPTAPPLPTYRHTREQP